jgi:hypothetical protein
LSYAGFSDFESAFMKRRPDPGERIPLDFTLGPRDNVETNRYLKKERGRHEEEESRVHMCILDFKTISYIKAPSNFS